VTIVTSHLRRDLVQLFAWCQPTDLWLSTHLKGIREPNVTWHEFRVFCRDSISFRTVTRLGSKLDWKPFNFPSITCPQPQRK
jgi:hypothetical protein